MSSNTNAANALAAVPSPPIICAAGSMCPHQSKIVFLAELKTLQSREQKEIFTYAMEKYKHQEGSREFKLAEEMEQISKARFHSIGEDIKKLEESS